MQFYNYNKTAMESDIKNQNNPGTFDWKKSLRNPRKHEREVGHLDT